MSMETPQVERRQVLVGGTLGAAVVVGLSACGSSSSSGGATGAAGGGSAAGASGAASDGGASGAIVALKSVPVGGCVIAKGSDGKPIVVARPTAGNVVAHSAICTHQGCTVAAAGAQVQCPCHGSVFNADTGANISGPAPTPLPKVSVTVQSGQVVSA